MFSKASIVALALVAVSNAHMIMTSPVPYGVDTLNNSPLEASGADFPCKQRDGVYAVTTQNTMELGGSYDLAFKGSAVHGGGSCQVSITYDETPSASSTFKVIHSIVGGCPMKNIAGNNGDNKDAVDPDTYNFTIPSTLPAGKATLAWTWFNKVGNREMYMNCAPVTLTGGSSKRSDLIARDQAAFSALPDMFTANIGNGCSTADSKDVAFPNPGDSVEYDGGSTASATAAPTGSCATAAAGAAGAAGAASAKPTGTGVAGAASAKPTGTGATTTLASYSTAPAATASSLPGGVFVSIATGTGAATSAATLSSTSAVSVPTTPTSVTSALAPAGTGASSTSSSGALTGACTSEGMFNCVSGTSYQQCGSGTWSVVMQMAAGTTCISGQTMNLAVAKRNGMGLMRHVARRGLGAEMFN
ncbi:hypothetical protein BPOR_0322g00080 [Botrytis porri]|uniref:Chitin-binding type-4 domain-containing protein n=1 Tax=Botrytis porri TaxID=87229 RepID=A0A4Z1KKW9_9HELO|nr:hypothetical protein BPOR_0322g00080 [Botrytis porri]